MQFFSSGHYGTNDFATFFEAIPISQTKKAAAVCALLDIEPDTLKRYLSGKTNPPKAMVRLLFHECHYGRSATDTHSHQGHVLAIRQAQGLQAEIDRLRLSVTALELEADELKRANDNQRLFAANSSRYAA